MYETKQRNNSIDQIKVFIPQGYFFYNYDIYLAKNTKEVDGYRFFLYQFYEDEIPEIEKIEESAYEYRINKIDNHGFELSNYDNEVKYKIRYRSLSFKPFQKRSNYKDLKFSYWIVVGELGVNKSFVFPQVPKYHEKNFESLENVEQRGPELIQIIKPMNEESYILITEKIIK